MKEADNHRQTQTGKEQAKHRPTRYRQTQRGMIRKDTNTDTG